MSFRKEQEAARDRAAEPINLGSGRIYYGDRASPRFNEDTVHRMFAEHQAKGSAKTVHAFDLGENLGYARFSFEDLDRGPARRETHYWSPGTGWTKTPPYDWKEDPDCTDPFRMLPDGTIDLHPSQWSVIA